MTSRISGIGFPGLEKRALEIHNKAFDEEIITLPIFPLMTENDIEDVITLETTSEIPEGDNNQLIERFTNMYTVEGFNNTRPNVQQDCRIIKSELISELKVNENQVVIDCKLNKQGEKYLIKVYFISNKENPLPEGLQEKLKKGVKIERLGITVKPTVSGLEDIDVEEGLGNKKMIIILISLIIAGIIGGIYLMNK